MNYNENSIRILSAEEAVVYSAFGIASHLSAKYPTLPSEHITHIAEALYITGLPPSLYERRYCSPVGETSPDDMFTQKELDDLSSLLTAFISTSK
ncbi:TPA: hypothetical protein ACJIWU_000064 [Enterobacter chengduensis]|uniref:Uncharacterized protein n=1 Tax=Enterobacter rongchengensis TaxID=3030999 RepID=A0ABV4JH48_9ENTR|nr:MULTISPECIES: hypothetical protein [Enterobacter cloacae complex]HCR0839142.1 hypothetical protein [Enterobacter cancerogenus]EKX4011769.1 hypothetical protein [Enterobacter cloacae]MBN9877155.1 hypothetical protein [Enterobacter chengduensis]MCK1099875.1 hypothetical protein [Enterobacter chengduensis]MCK6817498.1 hypothetical protein [Enterobacter chengduensis]